MKTWKTLSALIVTFSLSVGIATASSHIHKTKRHHVHTTHVVHKAPVVGARVTVIHTKTVVVYNRTNYYYSNGVFYRPAKVGFVVVQPPVGIIVRTMPKDVVVIVHRGKKYYNYHGAYFIIKGGRYHCVKAPR